MPFDSMFDIVFVSKLIKGVFQLFSLNVPSRGLRNYFLLHTELHPKILLNTLQISMLTTSGSQSISVYRKGGARAALPLERYIPDIRARRSESLAVNVTVVPAR